MQKMRRIVGKKILKNTRLFTRNIIRGRVRVRELDYAMLFLWEVNFEPPRIPLPLNKREINVEECASNKIRDFRRSSVGQGFNPS